MIPEVDERELSIAPPRPPKVLPPLVLSSRPSSQLATQASTSFRLSHLSGGPSMRLELSRSGAFDQMSPLPTPSREGAASAMGEAQAQALARGSSALGPSTTALLDRRRESQPDTASVPRPRASDPSRDRQLSAQERASSPSDQQLRIQNAARGPNSSESASKGIVTCSTMMI